MGKHLPVYVLRLKLVFGCIVLLTGCAAPKPAVREGWWKPDLIPATFRQDSAGCQMYSNSIPGTPMGANGFQNLANASRDNSYRDQMFITCMNSKGYEWRREPK